MTLPNSLWLFILTFTACSSGQQAKLQTDNVKQIEPEGETRNSNLFPFSEQGLNRKNKTAYGSYYLLTQTSDSTVKITWGNDVLERVYDKSFDLMFAQRLQIKWENKDYLVLQYSAGPQVWQNLVCPLNKHERVKVFDNGLCFDKEYSLLGTEHFGDTVLTIHNLKTKQKRYVIDKERPCEAATSSGCIDTISIKNKELYYKWTTPHSLGKKKITLEKRIRLTI